uniref:Next to BRCA1 gene 1 protein n=1 Tax=Varanus komodoensis TaxID=61221 RepID=A0A8D2LM52_VARKO
MFVRHSRGGDPGAGGPLVRDITAAGAPRHLQLRDRLSITSCSMDPQIHLSVTFRDDTQSFLISDASNTTWADVEAMVKVSFDLNNIQIKYLDEDHDEISVNTAEEYEEALKIAVKQGSRLQMNVYEVSAPPGMPSQEAPEKSEKFLISKDGRKHCSHCSAFTQTLVQAKDTEKDERQQFREQVVQETVERLEHKLNKKLLLSSQLPSSISNSAHHVPASPLKQGNPFDWLLSCSNCQAPIVGIRYQCSVCSSYSICEFCEAGIYAHDPNHVLLKLRRPVLCPSETYNLGQFSARLTTLEHVRLQKQMDKRFLKAEKQRLRAEKKQHKAEVRELKKQLKWHRKIHLWNSVHGLDSTGLTAAKSESLQPSTFLPLQSCPVTVPTLSAAFMDENLPDGTHIQPRTTFIKHWRMRNTGNIEWNSETKLKFMWGNLTLVSSEKKDVSVPFLLPGQVGVVSVEFVAPSAEGIYTSHWRLSHKGEQFGPRIWCSIVVDPSSSNTGCIENWKWMSSFCEKHGSPSKEEERTSKFGADVLHAANCAIQGSLASQTVPPKLKNVLSAREFYIPSVDLLTAQDLLSFELLDINIVQELEQVPQNITNDAQVGKGKAENAANQEEEDMSGTQFVCETVIRSLTLDAAPDHKPPQRKDSWQNSLQALQDTTHCNPKYKDPISPISTLQEPESKNQGIEKTEQPESKNLLVQDGEELRNGEAEDDTKDEVCSQTSSTSSEDYIIILPECFDTSRPLGESMYSSALSQPSLEKMTESPANPKEESCPQTATISDTLTTSQTLDDVSLNVEPQHARCLTLSQSNGSQEMHSPSKEAPVVPGQTREGIKGGNAPGHSPAGNVNTPACPEFSRHTQGHSLAGGLMKGAWSVAASAYKALFAGPSSMEQALPVTEDHMATFLANLTEMGFCDRHLNLRLLQKHNCDMAQVVTELLQLSQGDWYGN